MEHEHLVIARLRRYRTARIRLILRPRRLLRQQRPQLRQQHQRRHLRQQLLLRRHRRQPLPLRKPNIDAPHCHRTPTPTIQVTVQTNLAALAFSVDCITYSSAQTFPGCPVKPHHCHNFTAKRWHRRTYYGQAGVMAEQSLTLLLLPLTRFTQRISARNIT